jgi:hypothetical protein
MRAFQVPANVQGDLSLQLISSMDDAIVAGIEIRDGTPTPPQARNSALLTAFLQCDYSPGKDREQCTSNRQQSIKLTAVQLSGRSSSCPILAPGACPSANSGPATSAGSIPGAPTRYA